MDLRVVQQFTEFAERTRRALVSIPEKPLSEAEIGILVAARDSGRAVIGLLEEAQRRRREIAKRCRSAADAAEQDERRIASDLAPITDIVEQISHALERTGRRA